MKNPHDEILSLGASLKAGRLDDVLLRTPAGEPVLFRAQGLQVIRSEADEIDTGKSCTLVITPSAHLVSSVMVRVLRVFKSEIPDPMFKSLSEKLINRIKTEAASVAGNWENSACLDMLNIALAVKIPAKGKTPNRDGRRRRAEPDMNVDPFTGEPMDSFSHSYHRLKSSLSSGMNRGDEMLDATLGSFEKVDNINEENWVKIAGIPGLVVSGFWIPVLGPTVVLQKNTEERVARGASRRGLNPQLALLALANMRLRDQLHQKP